MTPGQMWALLIGSTLGGLAVVWLAACDEHRVRTAITHLTDYVKEHRG